MTRQQAWIVRRQALLKELRAKRLDDWLAPHLKAGEQLRVIDGLPATDTAETQSHRIWLLAFIVLLSSAVFFHGAVRPTLMIVAVVLGLAAAPSARQFYVAVTDRRFLLQPLSSWKARPKGPLTEYPVQNVTVHRFKLATRWTWSPTMVIEIAEPTGRRKMRFLFNRSAWLPNGAETIKKALEQQGPNLGPAQVWSLPPGRP